MSSFERPDIELVRQLTRELASQRAAGPASPWNARNIFFGLLMLGLFGFICIKSGMFFMGYVRKLEMLEQYEAQLDSMSRGETAARPAAEAAAQPNIYLMVGGQQQGDGGYPVSYNGVAMPSGSASRSAPLPPDVGEFLDKYRLEYDEHLRERSSIAPFVVKSGDAGVVRRGNFVDTVSPVPAIPEYLRGPLLEDAVIPVPKEVSNELKLQFSRDPLMGEQLLNETADEVKRIEEERGDSKPVTSPTTTNAILRRLAEAHFAAKNYAMSALTYAQLSDRQATLTVKEMMQWAKAAELSGNRDSAITIYRTVLDTDPKNADAIMETAVLYEAAERFHEAATMYNRLSELQPSKREWRISMAKNLVWAQRGNEALPLLRELYLEAPEKELGIIYAELLLSKHQFEEALPVLDDLLKRRQLLSEAEEEALMNSKLNALMAMQNFKDAAEYAALLLERKPGDDQLLLKLAVSRVAAEEFELAAEPFREYLAKHPDDEEVRSQLAESLMAAQDFWSAAEEFLVLSENHPDRIEYRSKRANALMAAQDWDAAVELYMELVNVKPLDSDINYGFVVSLRMAKNEEEAWTAATNYLRQKENDHRMLVQAGEIALAREDFDAAIRYFQRALYYDGTDYKSRIQYAKLLLRTERYPEAEGEFRKILGTVPMDLEVRRGLARALFLQRKYEQSFTLYQEMMGDDDTGAVHAEYMYRVATSVGMEDESSKQLAVLQELEPDDITWKGDRVQSLLRQRRFREAGEQSLVVYDMDPDYRATRQGMTNMNHYLTSIPVSAHIGVHRKKSKENKNEQDDRRANIQKVWYGLHGEKSVGHNLRMNADLDYESWNVKTRGYSDFKAYRLRLGGEYLGNPLWTARGGVGMRYFRDGDVSNELLYDLTVELPEAGGMPLRMAFYTTRQEHYDNVFNVLDELYAHDLGVNATYRWMRWDFDGFLQTKILSDDNYNANFGLDVKYRLVDDPRFLFMLKADAEYLSWRYNRDTYYSPRSQYQLGVGVDGRYYICKDPETWGSPNTYVDFGYSVYIDRFSNIGHKVFLGFNHDYTDRFSVNARLDYNKESYYQELRAVAGIEYKFGGCE